MRSEILMAKHKSCNSQLCKPAPFLLALDKKNNQSLEWVCHTKFACVTISLSYGVLKKFSSYRKCGISTQWVLLNHKEKWFNVCRKINGNWEHDVKQNTQISESQGSS